MIQEVRKPVEDEVKEIPQVLYFFGLGKLRDVSLLPEGDANHNYEVALEDGTNYVVKFTIEESKESLENDLAIEEQLKKAGIGTSLYIQRPDGRFIYDQGRTAVVSPRIDGIHPKQIDEGISSAIGDLLGRFHQAVREIPHKRQAWLNPDFVRKPIGKESDPLTQKAREFISDSIDIYDTSMPRGIIHGDVHGTNLVVDKNDPTKIIAIFDFEEAEENLLIVDIARTMLAVCAVDDGKRLDKKLMDVFINGYSRVRELTQEEKDNLPKAIKYAAGACMLWYMKNEFSDRARNAISRIESL